MALPRVLPPLMTLLSSAALFGPPASADVPASTGPSAGSAGAPPASTRIHEARTFAFALGAKLTPSNLRRLASRDLIVVDGDDATPAQITRLHARRAIVLGYLSVGSIESYRPWFGEVKDHRLEPLEDWDGERYADVSSSDLRDTYVGSIAPRLLAKGFDGLFLDNVDMVETHAPQAAGMLDLVSRLSALVHARGGALMAQNGDAVIAPYLPLLDAWNREDPTRTYDFDHERYVATPAADARAARATLRRIRAAGPLVTTADYVRPGDAASTRRAVRVACAAGAVPFVGDIGLKRVTARAPHC